MLFRLAVSLAKEGSIRCQRYVVADQSSHSLSPPCSRGCPTVARRPAQKLLHGAEFPRPESGAAAASEPGCSRGGGGQCRPDRSGAAPVAGRAAGWPLVGSGRLLHWPQRLSRPAALPPHRLELAQPRPQVRTKTTATGWTDQVAVRGGEDERPKTRLSQSVKGQSERKPIPLWRQRQEEWTPALSAHVCEKLKELHASCFARSGAGKQRRLLSDMNPPADRSCF